MSFEHLRPLLFSRLSLLDMISVLSEMRRKKKNDFNLFKISKRARFLFASFLLSRRFSVANFRFVQILNWKRSKHFKSTKTVDLNAKIYWFLKQKEKTHWRHWSINAHTFSLPFVFNPIAKILFSIHYLVYRISNFEEEILVNRRTFSLT